MCLTVRRGCVWLVLSVNVALAIGAVLLDGNQALAEDDIKFLETLVFTRTLEGGATLGQFSQELEKIVAHHEQTSGANHPMTIEWLESLVRCYVELRQYASAEPLARRLVSYRETFPGPEHRDLAASVSMLATLCELQFRHSEAEQLFRRHLRIRETYLGEKDADTANALNSLAMICEKQGRLQEAEPLYKRALKAREEALGPEHPDTAKSCRALAAFYHSTGRYALAEPLYLRAFKISDGSPDADELSLVLNSLASLFCDQARYAKAVLYLEEAIEVADRAFGNADPRTGMAHNELGKAYARQGDYARAEALLKRAIEIVEDSLGSTHPDVACILNTLGGVYFEHGSIAGAEKCYERALKINNEVYGKSHSLTATSLNNLALTFYATGQIDEAEVLCARALEIHKGTLGREHPETVASLYTNATVAIARGDHAVASERLDEARRGVRRHVSRVLPSLAKNEQLAFLRARDQQFLQKALSFGLQQQASHEIASLSACWLANGKAVVQEASSQQAVLTRQSNDPRTKDAVEALAILRAQLASLAQFAPSAEKVEEYQARLAQLQLEAGTLIHKIGGQLAELHRDEPWVEIDEIRANIPSRSVLVDLARFERYDFEEGVFQAARYVAWIIPPSGSAGVTIVDLGSAEHVDALVGAYRKGIDGVSGPDGFARGQYTLEQEMREIARPVAEAVLDPILDVIEQQELAADELLLSPDGQLWLLPWQALPLGDGEDAPYAIEEFVIRLLNSSRDIVPLSDVAQPHTNSTQVPIIFADPAFDVRPHSTSQEPATRGLETSAGRLPFVESLPATREEARASAVALQQIFAQEPKTFTGVAASEETLKREAVRPSALVLATHGYVLPDQVVRRDATAMLEISGAARSELPTSQTAEQIQDPMLRCGLLLAGANITAAGEPMAGEDGILTGAEIVGLDLLGTNLVVLSACQTGDGEVQTGEGVAGLRQAFQIAGARSVVATLWSVPDLESGLIMQMFYENVAKGLSPSKALREAQLTFINTRRQDRNYEAAHPYFWAAYGVTGR